MDIKDITVNSKKLPLPAENGFSVTKNKLWSSNTGRTTSGKMVGDIIAVKYTLNFTWNELNSQEIALIESAVGSSPFFTVVFPEEGTGKALTKTFYAADITYSAKFVRKGVTYYSDVSAELIEQ